MTELPNLSYEMNGFLFGRTTQYKVAQFTAEDPEIITNDAQRPRTNGIRFGRDFFAGRNLTWDITLWMDRPTNSAERESLLARTLDAQTAFATAWRPAHILSTPGAVVPLRLNRGGRTRRVYGRPRRWLPVPGTAYQGRVPITCDFLASDEMFYSDLEYTRRIPIIPPVVGGLVGPLVGPILSSSPGSGTGGLVIAGEQESWLTTRIYGPIIDPEIEVVGQWKFKLATQIASDQSIIIDPTPWERTVRRASDGANFSGKLTSSSIRLNRMKLPPGSHQVILRGSDITGTAKADIFWRDTFTSY